MKHLLFMLTAVAALPGSAYAGVNCSLGNNGGMIVCCHNGCGQFAVGCNGGAGSNYQNPSGVVGESCPSSIRPDPGDRVVADICELTEDGGEDSQCRQNTSGDVFSDLGVLSDYIGTDLVDELIEGAGDAPRAAEHIEDAVDALSGDAAALDSTSCSIERDALTRALADIAMAVEALSEAESAGSSTWLTELVIDSAFLTTSAVLRDASTIAEEDVLSDAWADYDSAVEAIEGGLTVSSREESREDSSVISAAGERAEALGLALAFLEDAVRTLSASDGAAAACSDSSRGR